MRSTTTTIQFDFNFRYARGGQFDEANAITLCEPGYDKRAVHRRMASTVMEALVAAQRKQPQQANTEPVAVEASDAAGSDDASNSMSAETLIAIIRMGMTATEFVQWTEWVQKELTGSKALAFVGSDDLELKDRTAVVDDAWMNIAAAGGVEAIDRVIGEFAKFFLGNKKSATSDGTATSS